MILGIMQPYFFPYIGYYDLIDRADRWVMFDIVQYHQRSWMNRNRILHPTDGWQYVTVPVKRPSSRSKIMEVTIESRERACERVLGQLNHYRGRAPHFDAVTDLVRAVFARAEDNRLVTLNRYSLELTCTYLGIPFEAGLCSEMDLPLPEITHPGQWALEISALLGADEYINPPGGREIFREEEWKARGIRLTIVEMPRFDYSEKPFRYEENLSILDVLMWNSARETKEKLKASRTTTS